jgi:hypothetical protein
MILPLRPPTKCTYNDVPAQKASMAVPPIASVMIGKATLRLVASSAAARVMIASAMNASLNLKVGLNSAAEFVDSGGGDAGTGGSGFSIDGLRDVNPPAS